MKNLVKKAKSKIWQAVTIGVSVFIVYYVLFYIMIISTISTDKVGQTTHLMTSMYYMLNFMILLTGGVFSLAIYHIKLLNIFADAKKFRDDISLQRHFHHLRMIEKYIELGDKVNSELLFQQYINSKYWDQNSASFFDGAIRSKFNTKLEFKITHNGKEIT